jgi:hypothetical protein
MPDPPVMPKLPPVSLDPEYFAVERVKKPKIKMSFAKPMPPPPELGNAVAGSVPSSGAPSPGGSRSSTPTGARRPSKGPKPKKPKTSTPRTSTAARKPKVSREAHEAAVLAAEAAAAYSRPTSGRAAALAAAKRVRAVATNVSDDEDDPDDLLPVKQSPPPPEPKRAPIPSLIIKPPIRPPVEASQPPADVRSQAERQAAKQAKRPPSIQIKKEELSMAAAQSPGGMPAVGSPAIPTPLRLKISLKPPTPSGVPVATIKKGTLKRCSLRL